MAYTGVGGISANFVFCCQQGITCAGTCSCCTQVLGPPPPPPPNLMCRTRHSIHHPKAKETGKTSKASFHPSCQPRQLSTSTITELWPLFFFRYLSQAVYIDYATAGGHWHWATSYARWNKLGKGDYDRYHWMSSAHTHLPNKQKSLQGDFSQEIIRSLSLSLHHVLLKLYTPLLLFALPISVGVMQISMPLFGNMDPISTKTHSFPATTWPYQWMSDQFTTTHEMYVTKQQWWITSKKKKKRERKPPFFLYTWWSQWSEKNKPMQQISSDKQFSKQGENELVSKKQMYQI